MFDFGHANAAQIKAVSSTEGPVLITAGPGTGKTYTLVQRAIYLIQEKGVKPEQILIATFTEKAARELVTRITNELLIRNISVNVNEMYVGTFHALCLRILKDHLEYTRIKKNYRVLDAFDQKYFVFQNIYKFRTIENLDAVLSSGGAWRQSEAICGYVNQLAEELVEPEILEDDGEESIVVLGKMLATYHGLLSDNNLLDFSTIQTDAYYLLKNNPEVLCSLQEQLRYIMIDEYQDTNYIQEQLVFLLSGNSNICVVGDDDQGLYRFRGATIRNILEFPSKFPNGDCMIIPLVINYRSNSDIVDFYNTWMETTSGSKFRFEWDGYRFNKKIIAETASELSSSAVVKLSSEEDSDEWHERILSFITDLKKTKQIRDYNQIAFLFNSVKHERVTGLARYLEANHINVYSPRSDMFFTRDEIRLALGCLMLMFPDYVVGLEEMEHKYLQPEHYSYFRKCIEAINEILSSPNNDDLRKWLSLKGRQHAGLKTTTDYAYSGLLYQLFAFEPFRSILDKDAGADVVDLRPSRNLALLTQIISKYEYLHRVDVLNSKYMKADTEKLFNLYLKLLLDGGITEYEDDTEYAPSGCVSFLTIHQSKGMEFPIVFVDSLKQVPRKTYKDLMAEVEEKYFKRPAFEPYDETKYFDFWRLYYTAFSRAQDLLILTCNEEKSVPSKYFMEVYSELGDVKSDDFDISEFKFSEIKDVNLKATYSFTSHISVYETCTLQYKFFKELEFSPIRVSAMLFGTLVHQTIEDVHRAALRHEEHLITSENIESWFEVNYSSLTKSEHAYLAIPQKEAALRQVQRYAEKQSGNWHTIQEAEVDVSLVKPDYIIEGKIDLIKGEDDTVELVDFKAEKKPDLIKDREKIEQYRRQLQVYAHLVEERTGHKVSKMNLYYTAEENGVPTISYPYSKTSIDATIMAFDDVVQKIMKKEYTQKAQQPKTCEECDFRYYCGSQ